MSIWKWWLVVAAVALAFTAGGAYYLTKSSGSPETLARDEGETWLAGCRPPFWGRAGLRRPPGGDAWHFRQTELSVPAIGGIRPKSVFQIGGPGTVGTGSIRGMPHLLALQGAGFSVWPFDPPGWPKIVEIYPRLFTQRLRKTSKTARLAYLSPLTWAEDFLRKAAQSDDALDASVSAIFMAQHIEALRNLKRIEQGPEAVEGAIWYPREH